MTPSSSPSIVTLANQNCLIMGGSGFIGTNLCLGLKDKVKSLKYFSTSQNNVEGVEWLEGNFLNDNDLERAIQGVDTLFHLISTSTPASSNADPVKDAEQNILQTLKLLEACRKHSVQRVIFLSSGGTVYGEPQVLPTPEGYIENPICAYGISKLAIEKYLQLYERMHGITCISLRVSNPYGPYQFSQKKQGVIGAFIAKALNDQPIEIWGDGRITRDYIYIDDLIEAIETAATYTGSFRLFNIGSGQGHSINEIAEIVSDSVDSQLKIEYRESRSLDVSKSVLDCGLAQRELAWSTKVSLETGIQQTVNWFQSSRTQN